MRKVITLFILILAFFAQTRPIQASDFESARVLGMGGAGHAAPMGNDSIYLNPSYASLLPVYNVETNYFWYSSPRDDSGNAGLHGRGWNFSLQDGQSELFQAGVGYTTSDDSRMIHLGASKAIFQGFGAGLGSKIIFPNGGKTAIVRDGTLGVSGVITPMIQSALVVDNILQTDAGEQRNMYRDFILGTKFNVMKILLLYFDPHFSPSAPHLYGHEIGVEIVGFQDFFLRFGDFLNSYVPSEEDRGNGYSIGAGWVGPKISFNYALSRPQTPVEDTVQELEVVLSF